MVYMVVGYTNGLDRPMVSRLSINRGRIVCGKHGERDDLSLF